MHACMLSCLSQGQLFVTLWTTQPSRLLCPRDAQARIRPFLGHESSLCPAYPTSITYHVNCHSISVLRFRFT